MSYPTSIDSIPQPSATSPSNNPSNADRNTHSVIQTALKVLEGVVQEQELKNKK